MNGAVFSQSLTGATLGIVLFAFLLGSIPFAYLAGRLRGIDIRQHGSGNVGATNALRVLGVPAGAAVLILDGAKGAIATWVGFGQSETLAMLAGLAAILGHTFSPFMRFKGGKGVASAAGVFLMLAPDVTAVCLLLFVVAVAVTRYVSVGSILAALCLPLLMVFWDKPLLFQLLAALTGGFVLIRHIPNMKRLMAGEENPIHRTNK